MLMSHDILVCGIVSAERVYALCVNSIGVFDVMIKPDLIC